MKVQVNLKFQTPFLVPRESIVPPTSCYARSGSESTYPDLPTASSEASSSADDSDISR